LVPVYAGGAAPHCLHWFVFFCSLYLPFHHFSYSSPSCCQYVSLPKRRDGFVVLHSDRNHFSFDKLYWPVLLFSGHEILCFGCNSHVHIGSFVPLLSTSTLPSGFTFPQDKMDVLYPFRHRLSNEANMITRILNTFHQRPIVHGRKSNDDLV
jgi:hypothetical protein